VRFFSPDSTTSTYFFLAFSGPQTTEVDVYTVTSQSLKILMDAGPGSEPEKRSLGSYMDPEWRSSAPIPRSSLNSNSVQLGKLGPSMLLWTWDEI